MLRRMPVSNEQPYEPVLKVKRFDRTHIIDTIWHVRWHCSLYEHALSELVGANPAVTCQNLVVRRAYELAAEIGAYPERLPDALVIPRGHVVPLTVLGEDLIADMYVLNVLLAFGRHHDGIPRHAC